jgi:hypothetical protein
MKPNIVEDAWNYAEKHGVSTEVNTFAHMFIPTGKLNEILKKYIFENQDEFVQEAIAYMISEEEYLICLGCRKLFRDCDIGSSGYCIKCHKEG